MTRTVSGREFLPAAERVRILLGRVNNLRNCSGDFQSQFHREQALFDAERNLEAAIADLEKEHNPPLPTPLA